MNPQSYNAADYNSWSLSFRGPVAIATQGVELSAGYITVGNRKVNPFMATAPVLLDNLAADEEVVTVTSIVNPLSQNDFPRTSIVATFTKAHGKGCLVRTSTFGLQEAVNDAFNSGGGLVIIDNNFLGVAGATALDDVIGDTSVGILDTRDGALINYTWNGSAWIVNAPAPSEPVTPLVDGATITWDFSSSQSQNASVTIEGDRTLDITGAASGATGTLLVTQGTGGNHTLTLPTGSLVVNDGGGAVTLSTGEGDVDAISFLYDGTNFFWTVGLDFS